MRELEFELTECCSYCENEAGCRVVGVGNVCEGHTWLAGLADWRMGAIKRLRAIGRVIPTMKYREGA